MKYKHEYKDNNFLDKMDRYSVFIILIALLFVFIWLVAGV
jgi:hypothetical protein